MVQKRLVAATAAYVAVHVKGTALVKLTEDEVILGWVRSGAINRRRLSILASNLQITGAVRFRKQRLLQEISISLRSPRNSDNSFGKAKDGDDQPRGRKF